MNFKVWLEATEHSLAKDSFIHFTPLSRAKEIIASGVLLMNPPYKKFGTDSVDAISTTFGQWVPGTQLTHIKTTKDDPVVAVLFQTNVLPYAAYPEEVKWNRDVPLLHPKIVSQEKAKGVLKNVNTDDSPWGEDEVTYTP